MDENASNSVVLELTLKGGPPWGFRIKERSDNVIISKVSQFCKTDDDFLMDGSFLMKKIKKILESLARNEIDWDFDASSHIFMARFLLN